VYVFVAANRLSNIPIDCTNMAISYCTSTTSYSPLQAISSARRLWQRDNLQWRIACGYLSYQHGSPIVTGCMVTMVTGHGYHVHGYHGYRAWLPGAWLPWLPGMVTGLGYHAWLVTMVQPEITKSLLHKILRYQTKQVHLNGCL